MNAARRITCMVLRAYQLAVSPLLGARCRFTPSCSHYAMEAVTRHGVIQGFALSAKRLLRCHPWSAQFHDPVPPVKNS